MNVKFFRTILRTARLTPEGISQAFEYIPFLLIFTYSSPIFCYKGAANGGWPAASMVLNGTAVDSATFSLSKDFLLT